MIKKLLFAAVLLSGCTPEDNPVIEEKTEAEQANSELTGLPEYATLNEEIDLSRFSAKIETDDEKERIIIFSDNNGEKQYESIYTKGEGRLVIADLQENEELFNESLDP